MKNFIIPVLLFLATCFSCGKNTAPPRFTEYPDDDEVLADAHPYIWEKIQDGWSITLEGDNPFPLREPWSLYLHYSWTGTEEDLPLEMSVRGKAAYDFYPKKAIDEPAAQKFKGTFLVFHSEQWKSLPEEITVKTKNGGDFAITGVTLQFRKPGFYPLVSDPGTIMNYPPSSWRRGSYETFCHNLYPGLLYLVSGSFETQSLFFKRLAFFTEKPGFVGRLAEDEEIADLRDWFAHDYKAGDLAAFYDLARKQDFPLNSSELILRDLLLDHGIIRQEAGAFREGEGALLGFSVESESRLFVYYVHESIHGLEFTIPGLQKVFLDFFNSLSRNERIFMRDALLFRGYNVIEDKQLLASETAAYLLQQSPEETGKYFREYVKFWYIAYHKNPEEDNLEGDGEAPAAYSDDITEFLAANPYLFGWRSSVLQKEFQALTGLNAKTFYDLLPR